MMEISLPMDHGLFRVLAWALIFLIVAESSFFGTALGEESSLKLMIVSDFHYLSPSLYQESEGLFEAALRKGDGKMTQYSQELLEALIQEVRHQQPDALILSGDLAFNGEKASHQELAKALGSLLQEGFPAWVIPGNHDINNPYARKFVQYTYEAVPNVTPDEFRILYAGCMNQDPAVAHQLSYTVRLTDCLWLAMCDAGVYDPVAWAGGLYTAPADRWLKEVLSDAKEAGAQVITVTHQSLIPHTDLMKESMTIANGEQMAQTMRESGIARLNLSGHLHIQHISEDNGIYDVATGAYAVPPFRYGWLTVAGDGSLEYEAKALCTDHLPEEMTRLAETWFEEITIEKEKPQLDQLGIPEEKQALMLEFAARLNHAYFSGNWSAEDAMGPEDPAFALWLEISERDPLARYLTKLPAILESSQSAVHLRLSGE